jgi:hypothetical protein
MYSVSVKNRLFSQNLECAAAARREPRHQGISRFILNNVPLTWWDAEHERLATLSPFESLGVRVNLPLFSKNQMRKSTNHAWTSAREAFAVLTTRNIASNITGIDYNTPQLTLQDLTHQSLTLQDFGAAQGKAVMG